MLPDLMTVSRAIEEGPQYEHIQSPLEKSDPLLCLFCHRRHPTLNLALMVDIRQSIVKEIFKGHEQPVWSSNRAFRVDRPIQKLTTFQPAIVLGPMFIPAHFQPIEETP
jgi:hypothetical protein